MSVRSAIGRGHYNRYLGSLKIGFNGLFGFSTFPLQMMMWAGFTIALVSALLIVIDVLLKIAYGNRYPMGIPTITVLVLFMGGVQLAAVGLLGEYVGGRINDEVRRRPLYAIDKAWNVRVKDSHGPMSGLRKFVQLDSVVGDGRDRPEQAMSAVMAREDPHG